MGVTHQGIVTSVIPKGEVPDHIPRSHHDKGPLRPRKTVSYVITYGQEEYWPRYNSQILLSEDFSKVKGALAKAESTETKMSSSGCGLRASNDSLSTEMTKREGIKPMVVYQWEERKIGTNTFLVFKDGMVNASDVSTVHCNGVSVTVQLRGGGWVVFEILP